MAYDADPWEHYWEFKGSMGAFVQADGLRMADNADWEWSGIGTQTMFIIGMRQGFGTVGWPDSNDQYIIRKEHTSGGHNNPYRIESKQVIHDPENNPREISLLVMEAFGTSNRSTAGDFSYPEEDSMIYAAYNSTTHWIYTGIHDSSGLVTDSDYQFDINNILDGNGYVYIAIDQIGDWFNNNFRGRLYWIALYNGGWPTTAQRLEFWNGTANPAEDYNTNLVAYIDFSQEVEATLTANIGVGANAPYVFEVFGTPTKGSSSVDDISIIGQYFGVHFATSDTLGHHFNAGWYNTQDFQANRFNVISTAARRKYPRLSIYDLGKLRQK